MLAEFEHLFRRRGCKQVHGARDDARPAGLMTRAQARAVVAMEIFVKQDAVAPVRIFLDLLLAAIHWPATVLVFKEDALKAVRDLFGHLVKIHLPPRAGRAFHSKVIPVVTV